MTGKLAKFHVWGEAYSAGVIAEAVPGFGPHPVGRGDYFDDSHNHVYFYLQDYHDMDVQSQPNPPALAYAIAELHRNTDSPNGKFGYPIVTGRGTTDRKEHWDKSWAAQFTYLLQDLMTLDTITNGHWPEFEAAAKQLTDHVIPRQVPQLVHVFHLILRSYIVQNVASSLSVPRLTHKLSLQTPWCFTI